MNETILYKGEKIVVNDDSTKGFTTSEQKSAVNQNEKFWNVFNKGQVCQWADEDMKTEYEFQHYDNGKYIGSHKKSVDGFIGPGAECTNISLNRKMAGKFYNPIVTELIYE